jgi:hypothetical protein
MILAIDFDGCIVENAFPLIGAERPGAIAALKELQKEHCIILWTCRTGEQLANALAALKDKGFTPDLVNENAKEMIDLFGGSDPRKIYAHLYVDDSALHPLDEWYDILENIKRRMQ